jgi:hypothetical protein
MELLTCLKITVTLRRQPAIRITVFYVKQAHHTILCLFVFFSLAS